VHSFNNISLSVSIIRRLGMLPCDKSFTPAQPKETNLSASHVVSCNGAGVKKGITASMRSCDSPQVR
jgi:hypothetical protein